MIETTTYIEYKFLRSLANTLFVISLWVSGLTVVGGILCLIY